MNVNDYISKRFNYLHDRHGYDLAMNILVVTGFMKNIFTSRLMWRFYVLNHIFEKVDKTFSFISPADVNILQGYGGYVFASENICKKAKAIKQMFSDISLSVKVNIKCATDGSGFGSKHYFEVIVYPKGYKRLSETFYMFDNKEVTYQ